MKLHERRESVRQAYAYRCGYCGVQEAEAGSELEIDHFQRRAAGGTDDLDNLVYCCSACNRLKGDFWPSVDPMNSPQRLLHPNRDAMAVHIEEQVDGLLVPRTETARFHIERLRLNRPPLVELRRNRHAQAQLRDQLAEANAEQLRLRTRIEQLTQAVQQVLDQLNRFLQS